MLLPGAGIMGSLPWPPSIYMGSGDLLSVPCVCTTNIWSTEPDPQTQHWLSCPPTTRRAPLFPAPLHRVLEMTEPWDHALKLLNFESQYLLLPLKGGKKKRRGERERRENHRPGKGTWWAHTTCCWLLHVWQGKSSPEHNVLLSGNCFHLRYGAEGGWILIVPLLKKDILFIFISCVWVVPACMYVHHAHAWCTQRPGRGYSIPRNWDLHMVMIHYVCAGN